MARALRLAGFEPHLVCVGASAETVAAPDGTISRLASRLRPYRQTLAPWHNRRLAREIERLGSTLFARTTFPQLTGVGREKGGTSRDTIVIHAISLWGGAAVLAARRLRRRGIPAVAVLSSYTTYLEQSRSQVRGLGGTGRDLSLRSRCLTVLERWWIAIVCHRYERRTYRAADAVYVHYDRVAGLIRGEHGPGVRVRRIAYCAAAAFTDHPPAAPPPGDPPFIVSVARADARKANDLLVHALATLRREGRDFRAAIVGGGRLLEDHRALIRRLALEDVVAAPGVIPDVQPLLSSASIFVLSTRAEQSGSLAVLEALQRGLPVVASGVDGMLEDLTDSGDALLVPPNDVPALANGLRRLLDDPALRARLGRAARQTFERRFSPAAFATALREAYAEFGVAP